MDTTINILIIDDDRATRDALTRALDDTHTTHTARNAMEALQILDSQPVDIVLSDLMMPGMNGIDLLEQIRFNNYQVEVIMISGQATIEHAVDAMKYGAYDFITKPVNLDRLCLLISKAYETKKLRDENLQLKNTIRSKFDNIRLDGNSMIIKEVIKTIYQVAKTTATALIEGETGTGKERVASMIHYNSPVAHGPFIKVNCSAFAEGVLESELFGHEKGAYTGAIARKKGRFELADGGTLFLDEIGDVSPAVQVKLLRFLQEKTFERVGGTRTVEVETRIISATNKDLTQMIKNGQFREDLYYRLRVVSLKVPPLRHRREDIPLLINKFVTHFADIHNTSVSGLTQKAEALIKNYTWPGNVRELKNCIESAVVMAQDESIRKKDLPDYLLRDALTPINEEDGGLLEDMGKKAVITILEKTDGDKTKAAKILGIGLRTLYRKLKKWEIDTEV